MESVVDLIKKLKGSKDFGDWSDRLNHQYMVYLLALLIIIGASQQYVNDPIHCWCPGDFSSAAVSYTKSYCWTADTYNAYSNAPNISASKLQEVEINYYQWVPHILCAMAFLFKLPFLIWLFLGEKSGLSLEKINGFVSDFVFDGNEENYQKKLKLIAMVLDRWLKLKNRPAHKRALVCDNLYLKIRRNFLTISYVLVKLLFSINCVMQFVLLDIFLRMNFGTYGYELLFEAGYMFRKHQSIKFPHVTWCDFEISTPEYTKTHRVQCVLPINVLNEKIFGIIWICLVVVSICTFTNCVAWIYILCVKSKQDYIHKLHVSDIIVDEEKMKLFTYTYLRADGCFLLRIIDGNSVDIDMADLVSIMWELFFNPEKKSTDTVDTDEHKKEPSEEMTIISGDSSEVT